VRQGTLCLMTGERWIGFRVELKWYEPIIRLALVVVADLGLEIDAVNAQQLVDRRRLKHGFQWPKEGIREIVVLVVGLDSLCVRVCGSTTIVIDDGDVSELQAVGTRGLARTLSSHSSSVSMMPLVSYSAPGPSFRMCVKSSRL